MPNVISGRRTMGGIVRFGEVLGIVRELDVDEIRREAETLPRLLVVAPDRARADELGLRLAGWADERMVVARSFDEPMNDLNHFDVIVLFDPDGGARTRSFKELAERQATVTPMVQYDAPRIDDDKALEATRRQIVDVLPERAVAFGRALPPFRQAAAASLTNTTSRANAQFALVSNLPSAVPLVGPLVSAGADLLVLTKNQLLLLFKIAAIHGRDLRDTRGILAEMIPVVGAGFLWRTAAREAASFLPLAAGTIPKVAIAYAGTIVIGRAADFYYRYGYPPTRRQRREFYRQAALELEKQPITTGSSNALPSPTSADGHESGGKTTANPDSAAATEPRNDPSPLA